MIRPYRLSCDQVLAQLSSFVDGKLSRVAVDAVELHLTQCSNCAKFGAAFSEMIVNLGRALEARTQPADLGWLWVGLAVHLEEIRGEGESFGAPDASHPTETTRQRPMPVEKNP